MSLFNIIHQFPGTVRSLIDEIEQEWCETIEELYPDLELPDLPARPTREEYSQREIENEWPDLELPELPDPLPEFVPGVTPLDEMPGIYATPEYWAHQLVELMRGELEYVVSAFYRGTAFALLEAELAGELTVVPDINSVGGFFKMVRFLEIKYGTEGHGPIKDYQFRGFSTYSRNSGVLALYTIKYASIIADQNARGLAIEDYAHDVWENVIEETMYDFETQSATSL